MDRAVILGASRGLGRELAKIVCDAGYPVTGFGRKKELLSAIRDEFPLFEYRVADFSKIDGQDLAIQYLLETPFNRLFCVAGGGPYGTFGERAFRDHDWAWEVTFRTPARVLHALAQAKRFEQVILVGSSIAEGAGDARAASYASAKHALKGLHASLRLEYPEWDVRLFSPGYMDTEMLPSNAPVRDGGVYQPAAIAAELWTWALSADYGGHKVYPRHPA